jgi:hypothetical protein
MISVCTRVVAATILLAIGFCGMADATPIVLTYVGAADATSNLPGVTAGDTIIFKVFADNGGSAIASQNWSWSDVTSASMQAGSYAAVTSGSPYGGFGGFTTDAAGHLLTLYFGIGQNGTDVDGPGAFSYFQDALNPIWNDDEFRKISAVLPPDLTNTSIAAATPIPAALPLFSSALGGLGFIAWRRRKSAA